MQKREEVGLTLVVDQEVEAAAWTYCSCYYLVAASHHHHHLGEEAAQNHRRQEVGEQSRYHQQEEEEAQILHQEPVGVERIRHPLDREEGGQNLPRREPVGVERSHPHQEEGEEQSHHLREGEEQIHHHHQVVEAGTGAAAAVGQEVEVERNHRRQEEVGMP